MEKDESMQEDISSSDEQEVSADEEGSASDSGSEKNAASPSRASSFSEEEGEQLIRSPSPEKEPQSPRPDNAESIHSPLSPVKEDLQQSQSPSEDFNSPAPPASEQYESIRSPSPEDMSSVRSPSPENDVIDSPSLAPENTQSPSYGDNVRSPSPCNEEMVRSPSPGQGMQSPPYDPGDNVRSPSPENVDSVHSPSSPIDSDSAANEQSSLPQIALEQDEAQVLPRPKLVSVKKSTDTQNRGLEPLEGELDFEDEIHVEGEAAEQGTENLEEGKKMENEDESLEEGEAEDDGEVSDGSDDDLEEGEVKDNSSGRKPQSRPLCRFFTKGQCTWGMQCRFIHPGVNDKGNYNMFAPPKPAPLGPGNIMRGGGGGANAPPDYPVAPPPPPPPAEEFPVVESAWERGLRHAKELMKKASRRKEQDTDFEDKRLNLGIEPTENRILEMDKENDFYGESPYRRPTVYNYYGYEDGDPLDHGEREARDFYRRGQYENFEVRWTRHEYDPRPRDRRDKDRRPFNRPYDREKSIRRSPDRERERWREDHRSENQPVRSRADEWRDPWRRSKTPKGRRSRSRGRNRRSFSHGSSKSYSSRSSRSSYSYSRSSSSKSSYSGSDRSYSRGHSLSRSRSRSASHSPPLPSTRFRGDQSRHRYPPARPSPGKAGRPRGSPALDKRKTPPITAPLARKGRKSDLPRTKKSRSLSYSDTGSSSGSRSRSSSSQSRSPSPSQSRSRSRSYSRSRSRSLSVSSVSSVSSNSSRSNQVPAAPISPPKRDAKKKPVVEKSLPKADSDQCLEGNMPVTNIKPSKDPLKQSGQKATIKLTLLNKAPQAAPKKEEVPKQKNGDKVVRKRPASPVEKTSPGRKSTTSRREELLKQLKAVEEAIARKRAKFS